MTTIQVYRNRRNSNKYIEVHNDGHYHNSLKQYLYWERNVITGEPLPEPVKNITEDIEEMISLLKQLTSGEKREVKGIMIGLQMAKQAGLTA